MINIQLSGENLKLWFAAFADFCGVNVPPVATLTFHWMEHEIRKRKD